VSVIFVTIGIQFGLHINVVYYVVVYNETPNSKRRNSCQHWKRIGTILGGTSVSSFVEKLADFFHCAPTCLLWTLAYSSFFPDVFPSVLSVWLFFVAFSVGVVFHRCHGSSLFRFFGRWLDQLHQVHLR